MLYFIIITFLAVACRLVIRKVVIDASNIYNGQIKITVANLDEKTKGKIFVIGPQPKHSE